MAFNFLHHALVPELVALIRHRLCAADTASVALTCRGEWQVFVWHEALRAAARSGYKAWLIWWFNEGFTTDTDSALWRMLATAACQTRQPAMVYVVSAMLPPTAEDWFALADHIRFHLRDFDPYVFHDFSHVKAIRALAKSYLNWIVGSTMPTTHTSELLYIFPALDHELQSDFMQRAIDEQNLVLLDALWQALRDPCAVDLEGILEYAAELDDAWQPRLVAYRGYKHDQRKHETAAATAIVTYVRAHAGECDKKLKNGRSTRTTVTIPWQFDTTHTIRNFAVCQCIYQLTRKSVALTPLKTGMLLTIWLPLGDDGIL